MLKTYIRITYFTICTDYNNLYQHRRKIWRIYKYKHIDKLLLITFVNKVKSNENFEIRCFCVFL